MPSGLERGVSERDHLADDESVVGTLTSEGQGDTHVVQAAYGVCALSACRTPCAASGP